MTAFMAVLIPIFIRGGLGNDIIDGDQGSDIYYVENTAPAEENTDILADFRRRSNTGEYDRLRIVVEANTPQAWTLDEVLTQANLRVYPRTQNHRPRQHQNRQPKHQKHHFLSHQRHRQHR